MNPNHDYMLKDKKTGRFVGMKDYDQGFSPNRFYNLASAKTQEEAVVMPGIVLFYSHAWTNQFKAIEYREA